MSLIVLSRFFSVVFHFITFVAAYCLFTLPNRELFQLKGKAAIPQVVQPNTDYKPPDLAAWKERALQVLTFKHSTHLNSVTDFLQDLKYSLGLSFPICNMRWKDLIWPLMALLAR